MPARETVRVRVLVENEGVEQGCGGTSSHSHQYSPALRSAPSWFKLPEIPLPVVPLELVVVVVVVFLLESMLTLVCRDLCVGEKRLEQAGP